jgi:hypothetical protein
MYEVEATFSAPVPFRQPVRVFLGRDVARKARRNSASNRALLAADLCTGRVIIERLTPRQAQQLARASYSYAHVARGLLPLERAAIEGGTLSLANVARRRNLSDAKIERVVRAFGPSRVLAVIERMAGAAQATAAE